MAEDEPEPPTRHPAFYFKNGTHIFQAGRQLYRLHDEVLAQRILLFEGMLTDDINNAPGMPAARIGVGDGESDKNPIFLDVHMATGDEFNALLDHIYNGEKNTDYSLTYLVAVLKLSHQWGCASGEDFALRRLNAIELSVPAALRLRIARVHNIPHWLKPALQRVIFTPLKLLTKADLLWLGYETYQVVTRVREEYEALRKCLAFTPPPISEHRCQKPEACHNAWRMIWILQIGERLQHPVALCALGLGWEMKDAIKDLDVSGMGMGCGELAKTSAMECPGIRAEDALVDQALRCLEQTVPVDRSYFTLDY